MSWSHTQGLVFPGQPLGIPTQLREHRVEPAATVLLQVERQVKRRDQLRSAQSISNCRFISFWAYYVILDPYKTVPLLSVLQPFFVHLSRQPFPAVYADLNL